MTDGATGPMSVDDYRAAVLRNFEPMPAFNQPLLDADGLVAAETITSPIALPGFDNSAMDGYAVRIEDLGELAEPATFDVVGEIGAGSGLPPTLSGAGVAKIMTGAPMPPGADAVVPYEWTDRGSEQVVIERAPEPGQHVRRAGEDVAVGDVLIEAGTALGPRHIGLLAATGHLQVMCRARPRVVILSTGSELVDPGNPLDPGQIYDGNSYLLAAAVRRAGALPHRVGVVGDDPEEFLAALTERTVRGDVVITSGGISQGDYDVVKAALKDVESMWFGQIAMQPGKPQGIGRLNDVPIFTLPGNPVSSYISFEVFVRPLLRQMMGLPALAPGRNAVIDAPLTSPVGKRQFQRGILDGDTVSPAGGAGSHLLGGLARANCLIDLPEDVEAVAAGDRVTVIELDG